MPIHPAWPVVMSPESARRSGHEALPLAPFQQARDQNHHAHRCQGGRDQLKMAEQLLNLGLFGAPRNMVFSMIFLSAWPTIPVSNVAQITRIANRLKASPLEK